jgi:hypothetical protein
MSCSCPTLRRPRMIALAGAFAALLSAGPLAAATTAVTYAQLLVDHVVFRHGEVLAAGIYSVKAGTTGPALVATASTGAGANFDLTAPSMSETHPTFLALKDAQGGRVSLPLVDGSAAAIGVLVLDFKAVDGQPEETYLAEAVAIRNQLQEIIPKQVTLFDPYTKGFDATDTLAQRINNTLIERHPDINVVAIHLTAPGEKLNRVWGINRPNFLGRPSDEIDTDTEKTGRIVMQVIPATHRMEVHMPMLDRKGARVGTLCTVYFWHDEREAGDLYARSLGVRDEARQLMPDNRADLFKP